MTNGKRMTETVTDRQTGKGRPVLPMSVTESVNFDAQHLAAHGVEADFPNIPPS